MSPRVLRQQQYADRLGELAVGHLDLCRIGGTPRADQFQAQKRGSVLHLADPADHRDGPLRAFKFLFPDTDQVADVDTCRWIFPLDAVTAWTRIRGLYGENDVARRLRCCLLLFDISRQKLLFLLM